MEKKVMKKEDKLLVMRVDERTVSKYKTTMQLASELGLMAGPAAKILLNYLFDHSAAKITAILKEGVMKK
jgi:hypothetical protein